MSYPYSSGPQSVRHCPPNSKLQNSNKAAQNNIQGYNNTAIDNQSAPDYSVNNYSPSQYNYSSPSNFENKKKKLPEDQSINNSANQQDAPLMADIVNPPTQFKCLLNGILVLLFLDCLIAFGGFLISLLLVLDTKGNSVLDFKIIYMMILGLELLSWMSAFLVAKQTETKHHKLLLGRIFIIIAILLIIAGYIVYFSQSAIMAFSLYMESYIIVIKLIAAILTIMMHSIYSKRRNEELE